MHWPPPLCPQATALRHVSGSTCVTDGSGQGCGEQQLSEVLCVQCEVCVHLWPLCILYVVVAQVPELASSGAGVGTVEQPSESG